MGIVVCTLNSEQDEVLCCPLCCCCCHRPCCPACWIQCPPPGPPCPPGLCPEARLHPHHQPCHQPRPSCRCCPRPWCCCCPCCCRSCRCRCCLNLYRRAGLKQDNKTSILNLRKH